MTFLATARVNYQARLRRAVSLSTRYSLAAEILTFYRHIGEFQRKFYERLPKRWGKRPTAPAGGDIRSHLNVDLLLDAFPDLLGLAEKHGPGPVAAQARLTRQQGAVRWSEMLLDFWKTGLLEPSTENRDDGVQALRDFLSRAVLQPYAEFVVSAMLPPALPLTVCRCPRCNSLPMLGVLRPEGDGGKRYLQCPLCAQEWEFRRIFCAYCGEDQENKLSVYSADRFPHIRLETCESCKHFLRTIDLTKDGHAVPIVDDLAAIPLTLWAEENGYKRIQENLFAT
jgi:Protein involved in formate dehydrogenase formation